MDTERVAVDAREQVRRWDAGDSIWTTEMGGIGPGYEQAIQVAAIELTRDNLGRPLPEPESKEAKTWGDDTLRRVESMGLSGAQWGAARQLAYRWLRDGPAATHNQTPEDRRILASNTWPHLNPQRAETPVQPETAEGGH